MCLIVCASARVTINPIAHPLQLDVRRYQGLPTCTLARQFHIVFCFIIYHYLMDVGDFPLNSLLIAVHIQSINLQHHSQYELPFHSAANVKNTFFQSISTRIKIRINFLRNVYFYRQSLELIFFLNFFILSSFSKDILLG